MELNFLLFPAPPPSYSFKSHPGQIVFVPRAPLNGLKSDFSLPLKGGRGDSAHIPCMFLRYPSGSSKVILYFHGNAEDVGHTVELLEHVRDSLGIHIICVEYPGYGIYAGSPDATRVTEDAINVYDYIAFECKWGEENTIVFGRSIGTGPAVQLAALKKPAALLLMSAYTSLRAVIRKIAGRVLQYAVRERFRNREAIKTVTCPVFLIHGMKDTLIPYAQSQELLQACHSAPCYLSLPEEMDHSEFDFLNDLSFPLKEFLNKFDIRTEVLHKENATIPFPESALAFPASDPPVNPPGFIKRLVQKYL